MVLRQLNKGIITQMGTDYAEWSKFKEVILRQAGMITDIFICANLVALQSVLICATPLFIL